MSITLLDLKYYDFYQIMLSILLILIGLGICLSLAKYKSELKLLAALYIWHTLLSVYYWYFTLSNTSDAVRYFSRSFILTPDFSPGTKFTESYTYLITTFLKSNYLNTALVANILGSLGLILLFLSLKKYLVALNKFWVFILFIPSMSFWSGGLGKDSISYMACCLFIYAVTTSTRPAFLITIAFLSMFMVRPHVAATLLISYIVYFIIKSKTHIILKAITLPIIATGLFFSLSFVQQYVGLEDASLDSISSYVDSRQSANQGGGSSLDIASMSYPMQMFTYVFRPLPFEAHSAVALITSIENTVLLFVFIYIALKSKSSFKNFFKNENLWLSMYAFLTCTMLALTTANLGIATRQKWMFMPVLIYLLIYAFHDYKTKKNKVYS